MQIFSRKEVLESPFIRLRHLQENLPFVFCCFCRGYNVQNFDIPYLLDRAEAIWGKKDPKLRTFTQWGRVKNAQTKKRETMLFEQ